MNTIPNRLVIYPKDVMNITGRGKRTAQKLLSKIRKQCNKTKSDFITVQEFCAFTKFIEEHVLQYLK